ncbi:MAG: hypothetical protein HC764_25550 [Pleurocapsa sp. CRU_1_2]|nr:hypothetical protein [Pleurocapsa sp. CRU_1_2]
MNNDIEYTPNNQPVQSNNLEKIVSSPNLVPALNGVLQIFSKCIDLKLAENERAKAAEDFAKAIRQFDQGDKKLDGKLKQEQDFIERMMHLTEKLIDHGQYDKASEFSDKVYAIVQGGGNRIVDSFNEHSTTTTISIVEDDN